jgi:D-alanyl-D-alanine-carboxypeptidase/D-alanyl-D-alanine-endopeptidase
MTKDLFHKLLISSVLCVAPASTIALKQSSFYSINDSTAIARKADQARLDSVAKIVRSELVNLLKDRHFSAISGAVSIKGTVCQVHIGKLADGKKPDDQTLYEIGSITKTYTGLLLSQAVYEHKILLDVDIRKYLRGKYPNLVLNNGQPITLRHLITHTSGLPMNINCNKKGLSIDEQLTCFNSLTKKDFFGNLASLRLENATGKDYHYSNAGVQLVGYILEETYGSTFEALLKKYIFLRSHEHRTFTNVPVAVNTRIAIGKDSLGRAMPIEHGGYLYAGGLKASTGSMARYMNMYLQSHDPVIQQAKKLLAGDEQYGRAYAWNTFNYNTADQMLYHNGGTFGTSSWNIPGH